MIALTVLAAGLRRNEYEQGSDIQADAGLTLYREAFTAYYRWFGFWSAARRGGELERLGLEVGYLLALP